MSKLRIFEKFIEVKIEFISQRSISFQSCIEYIIVEWSVKIDEFNEFIGGSCNEDREYWIGDDSVQMNFIKLIF